VSAVPEEVDDLADIALRVRERIVDMCAGRDGGHLGGSMSVTDILVTLYFAVLSVDPADPAAAHRDVLVLSKGHGALALYAVLAERGFFPPERLADYGAPGSELMTHPHPGVPGVEVASGSLGHGLPLGVGFAIGAHLSGGSRRCFVVLGDGELQEGSVWEAAMAAGSLGLDNLVAVVDRNGLQITGATEDVVALEPLADRWRAFGWEVVEVNGHDRQELAETLTRAPLTKGRPTVVIARTVKGRGITHVEGQARSHFVRLSPNQHKKLRTLLLSTSRAPAPPERVR
jgi:transketolase